MADEKSFESPPDAALPGGRWERSASGPGQMQVPTPAATQKSLRL